MDKGKVEESCEADGDGEDEDGIEDKEERRVHPVDEEVNGHVLRADFGQLVEARVEEGQDARRWAEGGCGGLGATLCSHQGMAATYGAGGTTTNSNSVLSTTHLVTRSAVVVRLWSGVGCGKKLGFGLFGTRYM